MAETPAAATVNVEDLASRADVACTPGKDGHTAAPCRQCSAIRGYVAVGIAQGVRASEALWLKRIESAARARLDATAAWATIKRDHEQLSAAFATLRAAFDWSPDDAAQRAHGAWITAALADGRHPHAECEGEHPCPLCEHELVAWDKLPEARRHARRFAMGAVFESLRVMAKLAAVDQARRAAAEELAKLRAPEEKAASTETSPA